MLAFIVLLGRERSLNFRFAVTRRRKNHCTISLPVLQRVEMEPVVRSIAEAFRPPIARYQRRELVFDLRR